MAQILGSWSGDTWEDGGGRLGLCSTLWRIVGSENGDFYRMSLDTNEKMFVHGEAPMVLLPEELPVLTLSQLQEDKSSISSICHPILST